MQNFIVRITQENINLLSRPEISCFVLPDTCSPEFGKRFITEAARADKPVLIEGENALTVCKNFSADGIILDTSKLENPAIPIKDVQKQAPHAVLGVICRNRRHEAMLVSECEPDLIIFKFWKDGLEHNKELLDWYAELFLIKNAAQIEDDIDFSALKADFVILDDTKYTILLAK